MRTGRNDKCMYTNKSEHDILKRQQINCHIWRMLVNSLFEHCSITQKNKAFNLPFCRCNAGEPENR